MRVVRSALLSLSFAFGVAGQSSISTSFLEQKAAAQQASRQNLRKRQNHAPSDAADSLVDASGDSECAYPPPFSPNSMYDGLARDNCFSGPELDVLNIEAAAFRLITASARLVYQGGPEGTPNGPRKMCFGKTHPDGRPYLWGNFKVHVVTLLDLIGQLQLLPDECLARHQPLRDVLLPARDTSGITLEYVTGVEVDPDSPPLSWWEDIFLPTAAEAFSCGFTDDDAVIPTSPPLPRDIRDHFEESATIQQVWRLIRGYMHSPQKQRENINRQQDFDVSLYIPFLKTAPARMYLGEEPRPDGRMSGAMRTGFPTYQGPTVWFLWHTIAARVADIENRCDGVDLTMTLSTVKTLVGYFGLTHPCPYCRYHFMTRVSRNDADWRMLNGDHKITLNGAKWGESAAYPLEYLYAGANLREKLDSIVDGDSLMLFFWKAHNTVTSTVRYSSECKTEEDFDGLDFGCEDRGGEGQFMYKEGGTSQRNLSSRNLGRAWPTATRYAFWFKGAEAFGDARDSMADAHTKLNNLDAEYSIRKNYATQNLSRDVESELMQAISDLDQAMLGTNLLFSEYALRTEPSCEAYDETMRSFDPLDVPLPLLEDGNFPLEPSDACLVTDDGIEDGRTVKCEN